MTVASSSTPTVSTIHHNTYPVMGMTCAACAVSLETYLGGQTGVEKVVVSYPNLSVFVGFDSETITEVRLAEAAKEIGYELLLGDSAKGIEAGGGGGGGGGAGPPKRKKKQHTTPPT
ncbi:MAG: cation transporter, partial [Bacteroidia bacterium]